MGETFATRSPSGPLLLAIGVGGARRAGQLPVAVRAAARARLPVLRDRPGRRRPDAALQRPGAPPPRPGRWPAAARCSWPGSPCVFMLTAVLRARHRSAHRRCVMHQRRRSRSSSGVLIIVLGLGFLGLIPGLQREFRIHRLPAAGLVGAPVLRRRLRARLGAVHRPDPRRGARPGHRQRHRPARAVTLAVAYCLGPRAAVPRLRAGLPRLHRGLHGRSGATAAGSPGSAARC